MMTWFKKNRENLLVLSVALIAISGVSLDVRRITGLAERICGDQSDL